MRDLLLFLSTELPPRDFDRLRRGLLRFPLDYDLDIVRLPLNLSLLLWRFRDPPRLLYFRSLLGDLLLEIDFLARVLKSLLLLETDLDLENDFLFLPLECDLDLDLFLGGDLLRSLPPPNPPYLLLLGQSIFLCPGSSQMKHLPPKSSRGPPRPPLPLLGDWSQSLAMWPILSQL